MQKYILGQEEVYTASPEIWSFKKVSDIVNNINLRLSNMAGGFPFEFDGHTWKDSERLYLCGEFSNNTEEHLDVQHVLLGATSGYAAKRFGKARFLRLVRPDFKSFRLQWMLFVVWQKCKGNADFRRLLLSISEEAILVENTTTDTGGASEIWGCKNPALHLARLALENELTERHQDMKCKELELLINIETNKVNSIGQWKGQNNIGKILMICRDCLTRGKEPEIDYDLLDRAEIHLLGNKIIF